MSILGFVSLGYVVVWVTDSLGYWLYWFMSSPGWVKSGFKTVWVNGSLGYVFLGSGILGYVKSWICQSGKRRSTVAWADHTGCPNGKVPDQRNCLQRVFSLHVGPGNVKWVFSQNCGEPRYEIRNPYTPLHLVYVRTSLKCTNLNSYGKERGGEKSVFSLHILEMLRSSIVSMDV